MTAPSPQRVCAAAELPPGARLPVDRAGEYVIVTRTPGGRLHAVSGYCPHQGADLNLGVLGGTTCAPRPGEYGYGRQGEILRCPWHQYEFDVTDGTSLFAERRSQLKTYEVYERDGVVYLGDRRRRQAP